MPDSEINLNSISVLIPMCQAGDPLARERLLNEMQRFLALVTDQNMDSTLRKKVGNSDIVQDSLVKIVERFDQFEGKTAIEFRSWLKRIVINEIQSKRRAFLTEKRDLKREITIDTTTSAMSGPRPPDANPTPSTQALARERFEKFHEAMERLAPDHAEVIRLRNIERLPFKEIGEKMERSEDAVSQLWFRAILKFEDQLRSSGVFESEIFQF